MSSTETSTDTNIDLRALVKSYGLLCQQKEQLIGKVPQQTITRLDTALSQLEEALAEPRPPTFDIWGDEELADIGVKHEYNYMRPHFTRKPGCEAAVAQAAALASDDLWSSENFIRQLNSITKITCLENETLFNGWVNAFFRRVMAMLPQDKHLTLHMETQLLPPIDDLDPSGITGIVYNSSGFMYYTVMLSRQYSEVVDLCEYYEQGKLKDRLLNHRQPDNVILVTAVYSESIRTCVCQAIHKMYTFAVTMKKKIVRGAVTRGDMWIFLILTMNDDFSGGTYQESETIEVNFKAASSDSSPSSPVIDDDFNPHYITAILMNWVQNSFSDLGNDDLFLQKTD